MKLNKSIAALPAGYMGDGGWTRKEESALA